MENLTIRDVRPEDAKTILALITELAIYEKAEHEVHATEETIRQSLFANDSAAKALIAENEAGDVVAYVIYFFSYSTWLAKNGLFLEDLYVKESERGKGIGKTLLAYLAKVALEKGCGRFEWNVLDWNQPAIDVYESIGAKPQSEWTTYRLTGPALDALAKQSRY